MKETEITDESYVSIFTKAFDTAISRARKGSKAYRLLDKNGELYDIETPNGYFWAIPNVEYSYLASADSYLHALSEIFPGTKMQADIVKLEIIYTKQNYLTVESATTEDFKEVGIPVPSVPIDFALRFAMQDICPDLLPELDTLLPKLIKNERAHTITPCLEL